MTLPTLLSVDSPAGGASGPTFWRVHYVESERGWGQDHWHTDYRTEAEAQAAYGNTNAKNTSLTAPDYYIQANRIEKIETRFAGPLGPHTDSPATGSDHTPSTPGNGVSGWSALTDKQRADIEAHIRGLTEDADTYEAPRHGWSCFHCGETFHTQAGAALHFGQIGADLQAAIIQAVTDNVQVEFSGHTGWSVTRASARIVADAILVNMPTACQGTPGNGVDAELRALSEALAAIRALGWAVGVHNDYRLDGRSHTFWLFTKGDRCCQTECLVEDEAAALNRLREQLREGEGEGK